MPLPPIEQRIDEIANAFVKDRWNDANFLFDADGDLSSNVQQIAAFDSLQITIRKHFEHRLREIVTTFYLPPKLAPSTGEETVYNGTDRYTEISNQLKAIPFPCIRIKRELHHPAYGREFRIETDVICWLTNGEFSWLAKDVSIVGHERKGILYSPFHGGPLANNIPQSYLDLIEVLEDRSYRYEESPVSRQVRRREGFSPTYREYIVIRKQDAKEHPKAIRLGEIVRRHPMLHAVRGHIRKLRSGRVTTVKPHTRGKGEMFQVKDYITEEEYTRA